MKAARTLCLCLLLGACTKQEPAASASAPSASPTPASPDSPREYALTGEVVALAPERGTIIAKHDEIPGYMPPMTMEFVIAPADFAKLSEGRRFQARLIDDGSGTLHLRDLVVLDPVKEGAVKAAASQLRQDTSRRGKEAYRELGETVPQFSLYDQDGGVFSISQVRGKWVVMNFIYTRCPIATMCPAATSRMITLQRTARERAIGNLELLSISLDPAYDASPVLKAYADARGIDGANFRFLTGPEGAVRDLLHQFGVLVEPGENFLKHTLSTLLIDPNGRIVHRIDGTTWSPDDILRRLPSQP